MNQTADTSRIPLLALGICLAVSALVQAQSLPERPIPAKREWFGEFYDLRKYAECKTHDRNPANVACDYLQLTRVEEPEFWPYPKVPEPKLRGAPTPAVYRAGMTSKQYFDALCKAEAGEFIYRTVENVEGLYQIRPRKLAHSNALEDRYVMEDPYGYTNLEATEPGFVFAGKQRYRFLEIPAQAAIAPNTSPEFRDSSLFAAVPVSAKVVRYYGYNGRQLKTLKRSHAEQIESRYGYTWRGIPRPEDRRLGIAGGELAVVDLGTGELLALRRGFILSGNARGTRSGIQWEYGAVCPPDAAGSGSHKDDHFTFAFIRKVLKPRAEE
jgi:hypothetical protein